MADIDVTNLRKLAHDALDEAINQWVAGTAPEGPVASPANEITEVKDDHKTPAGKRVVRTSSSGDRVYQLDEEKQIRQWVTSGDILDKLGWRQADVVTVEDSELLKYQMGSAIYRVDEPTA